MKRIFLVAGIGLLGLILSACTVTVTPGDVAVSGRVRFGIEVNDIIRVFEPTRGSGAVYNVGETISFRVRTNQDGYLTFTALDPDGFVYTFARNVFVSGGGTQVISGPDSSSVFALEPPRGLHRVRVSFTPSRTRGNITYRSVSGEDGWSQSIRAEVRDYDVRDIAETRFFLQ